MDALMDHIILRHQLEVQETKPLAGGDINKVLLLSSPSEKYVIKINNVQHFPGMFEAEVKGLQLLTQSQSFRIPKVIATGSLGKDSYLLLEYLKPGRPNERFWEDFAERLAKLHQNTSDRFGLDHDNYIGSLTQSNAWKTSADEFYIIQRIEPQIRMADTSGYKFSGIDSLYKNFSDIIPQESPSLIHGDLWNGNYLVSNDTPVLIDPSVAYSLRELDLGMMQLFGGFPDSLFRAYHEIFPCSDGWHDRTPLWQLYYILVHLNLFGAGYYDQANTIIKRYS